MNVRKLAQQITLVCDLTSLLYFCTLPFTSAFFFLSYPMQAIKQIIQLPDSMNNHLLRLQMNMAMKVSIVLHRETIFNENTLTLLLNHPKVHNLNVSVQTMHNPMICHLIMNVYPSSITDPPSMGFIRSQYQSLTTVTNSAEHYCIHWYPPNLPT